MAYETQSGQTIRHLVTDNSIVTIIYEKQVAIVLVARGHIAGADIK